MMNKMLKILIVIILFIFTLTFTSCRRIDKKANLFINKIDKTNYSTDKNEIITTKILKKLDIVDEKLIIDIIDLDDNSYCFIYKSTNGRQQLYKYENDNIKLLLEKSNMSFQKSEDYVYIYYNDIKSEFKYGVAYIDKYEFKECFDFNDGELKFSSDNKYFVVLNTPNITIYNGKLQKFRDEIAMLSPEFRDVQLLKHQYTLDDVNPDIEKSSFEFTENNTMLFVNYAISQSPKPHFTNSVKNLLYIINLDNLKSYEHSSLKSYEDKHKGPEFDPSTGDILYISSNIYPDYRKFYNDVNDFDFLWDESDGRVKNFPDVEENFLYLTNIYTNEIYVIDQITKKDLEAYAFNFTEDKKIEINGKELTNDIKVKENFVFATYNLKSENSLITTTEEEKLINKALDLIEVKCKALVSLTYNNVTYVVIKTDTSVELWRYENEECKKILETEKTLSIYNMVNSNNYLMFFSDSKYFIEFDEKNNIVYESPFSGFSKSPDGQYSIIFNDNKYGLMYKVEKSITIFKDNKVILDYKFNNKKDDFSKIKSYVWDTEYNKIYILLGSIFSSVTDIYSVDLVSKEVTLQDTVNLLSNRGVSRQYPFICIENSKYPHRINDSEAYFEQLHINKKYENGIYNLRTKEKIYLTDHNVYKDVFVEDKAFIFSYNRSHSFGVDLSLYIDKDREAYTKNIKDFIKQSYNHTIAIKDIELCQTFTDVLENKYQIVKISDNKNSNSFKYELWKINEDNFEKVFDNTNKIFLADAQNYLCIVDNDYLIKVYNIQDRGFNNCIIEQNLCSKVLLKEYDKSMLEIDNFYYSVSSNCIFVTIKANAKDKNGKLFDSPKIPGDMLADVVKIDLRYNTLNYTVSPINCLYDNFFIDAGKGYLIYQTGSSILNYNEERGIYHIENLDDRSLIVINLRNMKIAEVDKDYCYYNFYRLDYDKRELFYVKIVKDNRGEDETYLFDYSFEES